MEFYQNEYYKGSLTDDQCAILTKLISEDRVDTLKHIIKNANHSDIESIKKAYVDGTVPPQIKERGTLSDAQTVGVAFMYYARRCLMFDR